MRTEINNNSHFSSKILLIFIIIFIKILCVQSVNYRKSLSQDASSNLNDANNKTAGGIIGDQLRRPFSSVENLFKNPFDVAKIEQGLNQLIDKLYGEHRDIFLWDKYSPVRHSDHLGHDKALHFTNEWLLHIDEGENKKSKDEIAEAIAHENGYINKGQVKGFPDVYLFVKEEEDSSGKEIQTRDFKKRGARNIELMQKLQDDSRVNWADEQFAKMRTKRIDNERGLLDSLMGENKGGQSIFGTFDPFGLFKNPDNHLGGGKFLSFNDELWGKQWYLHNTKTKRSSSPSMDLNVIPVFEQGITGRGINVVVLDDGLEHTHKDLISNYNPAISGDLNDDDDDPMPRYSSKPDNSHGTRCAGEIAMKPNNTLCGVGVAYNARIGGVRMLDGPVSDRIEGQALSFALDKVDVYSASWGPNDDGQTVEGPGRLAQKALINSVLKGRGGKGTIHVWASGNGGAKFDCCSADGYASSIYTISIGSAAESDTFPWYGEKCPSTLAVTYSSGAFNDQKVATTDLSGKCTTGHTGTSAAAPLAAGIMALALEANPDLTWRDLQHLVIWTSQPYSLKDNPGWKTNAAGFHYNSRFGFGLMDAQELVKAAKTWIRVPQHKICRIKAATGGEYLKIDPTSSKNIIKFDSKSCKGTVNEINFLEHIELVTSIDYTNRGALQIELISPSGTDTELLYPRKLDDSVAGFKKWPFMSVHTWGEDPSGTWIFNVFDVTKNSKNKGGVKVNEMELILYGTKEPTLKSVQVGKRAYPDLSNMKDLVQNKNSKSQRLAEVITEVDNFLKENFTKH